MTDEARWRSIAEARWARFFTEIGWRWDYEYGLFDDYLPDFLLTTTGRTGVVCEVKGGAKSRSDLEHQCAKLWSLSDTLRHLSPTLLAVGDSPRKQWWPFDGKNMWPRPGRAPFACGLLWSYQEDRPVPVTFAWCEVCGIGLSRFLDSCACVICREKNVITHGDGIWKVVYDAWQVGIAAADGEQRLDGMRERYAADAGHRALDDEYSAILCGAGVTE